MLLERRELTPGGWVAGRPGVGVGAQGGVAEPVADRAVEPGARVAALGRGGSAVQRPRAPAHGPHLGEPHDEARVDERLQVLADGVGVPTHGVRHVDHREGGSAPLQHVEDRDPARGRESTARAARPLRPGHTLRLVEAARGRQGPTAGWALGPAVGGVTAAPNG